MRLESIQGLGGGASPAASSRLWCWPPRRSAATSRAGSAASSGWAANRPRLRRPRPRPRPDARRDDPRPCRSTTGQPALSTPAVDPARASTGPRLTPKPRVNKPVTEADPLVTRVSLGRSDNGSQFGMFLQVFADGTIIDGEGVHHVGREALKPSSTPSPRATSAGSRGTAAARPATSSRTSTSSSTSGPRPAPGQLVLLLGQHPGLRPRRPPPPDGPRRPPGQAQPAAPPSARRPPRRDAAHRPRPGARARPADRSRPSLRASRPARGRATPRRPADGRGNRPAPDGRWAPALLE